ncbi:hypothetical protein [uncultured Ruegeria sp.]|uniref:hypothetical protein n=1 Tax=uncultured Ruegeria sp. TaxID=259304 RepID=UPI002606E232|nr:hypothetical protein [uncultured Ruegeria sp.]
MTSDEFVDPLGVLGDGEWEMILVGEETRRGADIHRVATTSVEVTLKSEEDFERFFEIIKASDERLAKVTAPHYDWQMVLRKGMTIRFGVAWYDLEFFMAHKDAYLSDQHSSLFDQFNIEAADLKVHHHYLLS